jgi:hypothetical protein
MKAIGFLGVAMLLAALTVDAEARGGGGRSGRVSYGGGHHTTSHGGTFAGSSGSSHKGGTYRNYLTGNQYGTHK